MKMFKNTRIILAVSLVFMLMLSACGTGSTKTSGDTTSQDKSTAAPTESVSEVAPEADPLGKYEPAIDLTIGRQTDSSYKFVEGESFDNNIWITEYKDKLGINVKHEFIVDATQYDAKVNVVIASGDIPDVMLVTAKQTKMLMESDLIHDITDAFDTYASPMSKKAIISNEKVFSAAKIDGKLMGIPMIWALDFALNDVWVRADWMKKLNLPEPKTADDFIKIAEAFTTQDPDGNNKADTFGIALDKGFPAGNLGSITGWLNMFHAYKEIWLKDASGQLVYSSIQPEMKAALQKLADLYKRGIIDQEFGVKDGGKITQDIVGDKVGMEIGAFWNPAWPLQDLKNKTASSDWTPYPILSNDDKPALSQANVRVDQFFVISKECEHPESFVKMLNLNFENLFGSQMDEWDKIELSDKYKDIQTFKYPAVGMEPPTLNRDLFDEIQTYLQDKDESKVKLAKDDLTKGKAFLAGDNKAWCNYKIRWEKNGGMGVLKNQIDSGNIMYNENYGIPGPVNVEKSSSMIKLENEVFTKIIMNAVPIDEFDKFIEQWKKIGGNELTKEVNDWYAEFK